MNRNDRAITALVMVGHAMVHTYEMVIPLFVVIWLIEFEVISLGVYQFDVTTATIGIVVTIGYGLFGLGALPSGVLVDRFGSRRLITGCLFGMGISYLLLGLSPNMVVVALALIVWGIAASVYHPAGLSLVSKGVRQRGTGFAYHGVAGNLGIGGGPLVAAIMLLVLDWRTVAIVLAVPALFATIYAARADFDETAAVEQISATNGGSKAQPGVNSLSEFLGVSRRLFAGSFVLVFVIAICSGLYYRGLLTFLPELLRSLPGFDPVPVTAFIPEPLHEILGLDPGAGKTLSPEDYFYSGLLVIGALGQYTGGKLTNRFPVEYSLSAGFALLAFLGLLFVPVSTLGIVPLMGLGAVLGVSLFLVQPMYQVAIAEHTPSDARGVSYGYTYLGVFGIGASGGAIAGAVLAYADGFTLFVTLSGFALLASLIALYLART